MIPSTVSFLLCIVHVSHSALWCLLSHVCCVLNDCPHPPSPLRHQKRYPASFYQGIHGSRRACENGVLHFKYMYSSNLETLFLNLHTTLNVTSDLTCLFKFNDPSHTTNAMNPAHSADNMECFHAFKPHRRTVTLNTSPRRPLSWLGEYQHSTNPKKLLPPRHHRQPRKTKKKWPFHCVVWLG
jgi:hypothetical protein